MYYILIHLIHLIHLIQVVHHLPFHRDYIIGSLPEPPVFDGSGGSGGSGPPTIGDTYPRAPLAVRARAFGKPLKALNRAQFLAEFLLGSCAKDVQAAVGFAPLLESIVGERLEDHSRGIGHEAFQRHGGERIAGLKHIFLQRRSRGRLNEPTPLAKSAICLDEPRRNPRQLTP
jgi:hypothetical protein